LIAVSPSDCITAYRIGLNPVEQIKYKLVDVQPAKAVIVNTQEPNAPIEIGFVAL
jgi:hypothetical protein